MKRANRYVAWQVAGIFAVACGCVAACGEAVDQRAGSSDAADVEQFAGTAGCAGCHDEFYEPWIRSRHGLAMQPWTADFAAAELEPQAEPIAIGDFTYRVDPESGTVIEAGPEAGPAPDHHYPIEYVLGGKNVYYFLTRLDRGRLQVLPVGYDVGASEWFGTPTNVMQHFGDDVDEADWQAWPLTFNTFCWNCHVSQLSTHYDPEADAYHTTWVEPGINCETCHGSAAKHVRACEENPDDCGAERSGIIANDGFTAEQNNSLCAACHAKLIVVSDDFGPRERFFDHFDLIGLEGPDFYPDGRDLGENYTYSSWMMSKCAREANLQCLDCHNSRGEFLFEDQPDEACAGCHAAQAGNALAHMRHAPGTAGGQCVDCHMPQTTYARMIRTDHSMLPPAPAATSAFLSPNACTLCHREEGAAWADARVREWGGANGADYQRDVLYRGELIREARGRDWTRLEEMLAYLQRPDAEPMFEMSLIRLLQVCDCPDKWPVMRGALSDPSPIVRGAAANALALHPTAENRDALIRSTADDYRMVRVQAAYALSRYPPDALAGMASDDLERATAEYVATLDLHPDRADSHQNRGNYLLSQGDVQGAIEAFRRAIALQPSVETLVDASTAYASVGDASAAEATLRWALDLSPRSPEANLRLGLLLVGTDRDAEAAERFLAALEGDPSLAVAAYNLAVLAADEDLEVAVRWSAWATKAQPGNDDYAYTYAFYLDRAGQSGEAIQILESILRTRPDHAGACLLLGRIQVDRGNIPAAVAVYRRALATPDLPAESRRLIEERLAAVEGS